jgi:hypothetical protein
MLPGYVAPSAPMVVPPVLPLVEFETIFSAMGLSLSVSGATIFPTFTVPMNSIKMTIATNPALANLLAYENLSSNAKKDETANKPTMGTADETNTDLFGNSKGENDDIVNSIKIPEITVASTRMMSLVLRLVDVPEGALGEAEGDAPDNGGDI